MTDTTLVPYGDDDLVYVDPDARTVVGKVEWNKVGNPKSLPLPPQTGESDGRRRFRNFYPWGTYRSMKRIYHLEGKRGKDQPTALLDDVLAKALEQPFWDS